MNSVRRRYPNYLSVNHDHYHHVNQTVNEHRAPTDESVKLLKELEAAALDKIVSSIRIEDNTFTGVIHKMIDPLQLDVTYLAVYTLNGEKIKTKCTLPCYTTDTQSITKKIRDAIAEDISNRMTASFAQAFHKENGRI